MDAERCQLAVETLLEALSMYVIEMSNLQRYLHYQALNAHESPALLVCARYKIRVR